MAILREHIHAKGKIFFPEIKSNKNIFQYHLEKQNHCYVKPDKLVTLIKKHCADNIMYITSKSAEGSKVSYKTRTNQLNASAKTAIINYLLRWGIEHFFK